MILLTLRMYDNLLRIISNLYQNIQVRKFSFPQVWIQVLWHIKFQFGSVQSLTHVWFFATPWIAAGMPITNFRSLLKLMSIASLIPSNHLILCRPLLLPPSIFPSIRVFSNESVLHIRWPKYGSFGNPTEEKWCKTMNATVDVKLTIYLDQKIHHYKLKFHKYNKMHKTIFYWVNLYISLY